MTLTAGQIIDQARNRHPGFFRTRHPDKVVLGYLSSYVRRLHGRITAIDARVVETVQTTTLPLGSGSEVDHEAGIALPANTRSIEGLVATWLAASAGSYREPRPIDVLDFGQRLARNAPTYAAWQDGARLYLRAPLSLWTLFSSVTASLVVLPAGLATTGDSLSLPDASELACIEACAFFLAQREKAEGGKTVDLPTFRAAAAAAEQDYLDDLGNNVAGRRFFTADTGPTFS